MSTRELKHAGLNLQQTDPKTHEEAESRVFGFWVFLMSDAVLFALLFATYGVMLSGTAGGPGTHNVYEMKSAFIETLLLLSSSFTFGMASLAMKYEGKASRISVWLAVTLILGLGFLGMEMHDFVKMIGEGATPERSGFLSSFFALVSTHGLHVLGGSIWIVVMLVQLSVFGVTPAVKTRILRLGLFWHFLDIIWVGIFTIVYLQGLTP